MSKFSKTQIDKLGDRLRSGVVSDDDLRMLDEYRRSYGEAYRGVVQIIRDRLGADPIGRSAKSTSSIIDKLKREETSHTRLSQIQDIAGCRIVVDDMVAQDAAIAILNDAFPNASIVDRRKKPNHGYRAVHVVAKLNGLQIEIQVRSKPQHIWAELCEKLSDLAGPMVKYGGGPENVKGAIQVLSLAIAKIEGNWRAFDPKKRAELLSLMQNAISFSGSTDRSVDKQE